jgi:DNA polymerase-3 subunit delta
MLTHGEDSVRIISLLAWQIKRLWRAKQMLNQGGNEQKVASELQIIPFFAKRFFEQVKLYTEKDLMKNHALLLETDVKSKTSSLSTKLLLELLVYKLCV